MVYGKRRQNAFAAAEVPLPPMGIGCGSLVKGAIIDKNARIGANCVIANREGGWLRAEHIHKPAAADAPGGGWGWGVGGVPGA